MSYYNDLYNDLKKTFEKIGFEYMYNYCLGLSDENYKTHNFNESNICNVCGMVLEDVSPVLISEHNLSCVEFVVKNIIE